MMRSTPLLTVMLVAAIAGCGASSSSVGSSSGRGETSALGTHAAPPIEKVWRARCGACHTRVEPGTRSRAALEVALSRHRKRVHLRESQWQEMLAFLAPGEVPVGVPCVPSAAQAQPSSPPLASPSAPSSLDVAPAAAASPNATFAPVESDAGAADLH